MRFKEWLLTEDLDAGEFFYALTLYPSDAFDGSIAFENPHETWSMQNRWKIEKDKWKRPFLNLNQKEYVSRKFVDVESKSMPGVKNGFWRHKEDDNSGDLKIDKDAKLGYYNSSKNGKAVLYTKNSDHSYMDLDLKSIFGDEGTNSTPNLSKNFDKPFRKVYEDVTPYIDVGTTRNLNTNMGVASKYLGPDETGEKETEEEKPVPMANFGFKRKRRKPAYIQSLLGRSYVTPQEPNYYVQGQPGR